MRSSSVSTATIETWRWQSNPQNDSSCPSGRTRLGAARAEITVPSEVEGRERRRREAGAARERAVASRQREDGDPEADDQEERRGDQAKDAEQVGKHGCVLQG